MYLQLGFEHIADFVGYDHILFIMTLCAVYSISQWKKILVLVTAFTVGHSTTLVLATLHIINIPSKIIEFLIPVTIFITAFANILQNNETISPRFHGFKYSCALFFGLIHGLGFSNYLRSLLGIEKSIVLPLFSFNVGIEAGQLAIVTIVTLISYGIVRIIKAPQREWHLVLSGAGLGISLILMIERFPWK